MASNLRLFRQDDFTGGLNLRSDQFQLADNESPDLLNMEIDPRGGLFSRGAMRRRNTSAVSATWTPKSMYPFYGSSRFAMISTGSTVFASDTANTNTNLTVSSVALAVTAPYGASFAQWGTNCYIAVGASGTAGYKFNGTTTTALTVSATGAWQESYQTPTGTHMPKANLVISHAGKLFVADTNENSTAFPNRLRWSHPNSPESWASLDYIDINDGSSGITGLASFNGALLIFKDNATYMLLGYDSTTFQVVEVSRKVGCLSPQCVAVTERGVFFWSSTDGLMWFNGKGLVNLFEPLLTAIQLNQINSTSKGSHYVNEIAGRIWVSVPYSTTTSVTYPTTSFVYDPSIGRSGSWTRFANTIGGSNYGIAGGCTFIASNGEVLRLALHPNTSAILKVDDYNYDTDAISTTSSSELFTSYYRTRWIDGGSYSQKKMFRRPDFVLKQVPTTRTMTVDVYHDYEESAGGVQKTITVPLTGSGSSAGATALVWGVGQWNVNYWSSPNVGSFVKTISTLGLARSAQMVINGPSGSSGSRYWGIDSMTLKYSPRKVRA